MKELNPANWIYWFGLITIASMILPIFVVLVRQQFSSSFIALVTYFLLTFLYNFIFILFPNFPRELRRNMAVAINFLDAPLMLFYFKEFAHNKQVKRLLKITLSAVAAFQLVVIVIFGFNVKAISVFEGPAILVVLTFAFYFFARHLKLAFSNKREVSKTLTASGILFAYTIFFMIYLFYYVLDTPYKVDALIVYFFASFVSSLLVGIGLLTFETGEVKNANHVRVALDRL